MKNKVYLFLCRLKGTMSPVLYCSVIVILFLLAYSNIYHGESLISTIAYADAPAPVAATATTDDSGSIGSCCCCCGT